jgi:hypothetical protein
MEYLHWFWTLHIPIDPDSLNNAPWFMPLTITVIVCLEWCREDVQIKHSMLRLLAEFAKQSSLLVKLSGTTPCEMKKSLIRIYHSPFLWGSKITYQKENYFFFL